MPSKPTTNGYFCNLYSTPTEYLCSGSTVIILRIRSTQSTGTYAGIPYTPRFTWKKMKNLFAKEY